MPALENLHSGIINEIAEICHDIALDHGFWQSDNFGEKIALIHSELSEALESKRKGDKPDEHCPGYSNTEIELADAIIRIFDLAVYLGYDVGDALAAKIEFNRTRPFKHGKQF